MNPVHEDARIDSALDCSRLTDRRIAILGALEDQPAPVDVCELLVELVSQEGHAQDSPAADRIAARLHHIDLPLLDDAGLLEYDVEDRTVSRRPDHRSYRQVA